MRRTASQEHAVLLTKDADGTERTLIDPIAIDPSGLTTLDSWQPTKEGHLLAYQLSEGGTEESVVRVLDVVTGEHVDGPIDRARYTPIAWLPGGASYYYVRRLAPELVPGRRGAVPPAGVAAPGRYVAGRRRAGLRRGPQGDRVLRCVSVSRDGQWLLVSAAEGTAPRNDLWVAHLPPAASRRPHLRPGPGRRRRADRSGVLP